MRTPRTLDLRSSFALALVLGALLVVAATQASAFPQTLDAWQDRYGATSPSGDNAECQLCHVETNGEDV